MLIDFLKIHFLCYLLFFILTFVRYRLKGIKYKKEQKEQKEIDQYIIKNHLDSKTYKILVNILLLLPEFLLIFFIIMCIKNDLNNNKGGI